MNEFAGNQVVIEIIYLVASALFILSLKWMSSPTTARHGVWAGELVDGVALRPSRGSHLLVRSAALGNPRAMLNVPVPGTFGRFVFAVPREDGLVMIGLMTALLRVFEVANRTALVVAVNKLGWTLPMPPKA